MGNPLPHGHAMLVYNVSSRRRCRNCLRAKLIAKCDSQAGAEKICFGTDEKTRGL